MKIHLVSRNILVLGCLLASALTSGCALFDFGKPEGNIKVSTQTAFSDCLKMCYDSDTKTRNSYTSCLDGCGRAAATYPLKNELYSTPQICEEEVGATRKEGASKAPGLCANAGDYRRVKGCEEGVTTFYRVLTSYSACEPVHPEEHAILEAPGQGSPEDGHVLTQDLSE